ncbi:MAG: hypothetical protein ABIO43_02485, partial [Sphingomicrobium sp.]
MHDSSLTGHSWTTAGLAFKPPKGATIRQIAALPYRSSGPALDSPVAVLLVTTRATKRWVIPKG